MIFERVCFPFWVVPPVLWLVFNSDRSPNRFLLRAVGCGLLLLAFYLAGFILRESRERANVLADGNRGDYPQRPSARRYMKSFAPIFLHAADKINAPALCPSESA